MILPRRFYFVTSAYEGYFSILRSVCSVSIIKLILTIDACDFLGLDMSNLYLIMRNRLSFDPDFLVDIER